MSAKYDNTVYEIILELLKNKTHIRELSRKINISHDTVFRKLNQLEKDGFIDYKKIGRNKVFFLKNNLKTKNLVFMAERYKQLKLYSKYPNLEVIFDDILKEIKKMAILFGSYAKFKAKKTSDIDIYIETKNKKIQKKIEDINSKLSVHIGKFDKNSPLIKEIIKDHVIIKNIERFYKKVKL